MTGWVRVDDWGTVKAGQRVRLEAGCEAVEFELRGSRIYRNGAVPPVLKTTALMSDRSVYWRDAGWTLFVESRPVPALPTEPGLYADSRGFPWGLNHAGKWSDFEGGKYADRLGYVEDPTIFGPFIRLEPVPVTAKKVLEALEEQAIHTVATRDEDHRSIYDSIWDEVARQFGVTTND